MNQKIPVVIASVLKPLNDSRVLYKLAFSLRETNKYGLNIIGFSSKKTPKHENIRFISVFSKNRKHLIRIFAPFKMLWALFRIRPSLLIVTTYELLPAAAFGKILLGYKLVYDVQENYSKNVVFNETLPKTFQKPAEWYIKSCETITARFIDHYIFAEKCYAQEFPEISNFTVIENKSESHTFSEAPVKLSSKHQYRFLISGTITPVYGIKNALKWFLHIRKSYPNIQLDIVGHAPLHSFQKELETMASGHKGINMHIAPVPISFEVLKEYMIKADVVVLPYLAVPSIQNKVPTKLYDALALHKPIMISQNPVWEKMINRYQAGLSIDFSQSDQAEEIMKQFLASTFYTKKAGEEVCWKAEKNKFIHLVGQIIGSK